jgi:hypothetical protein
MAQQLLDVPQRRSRLQQMHSIAVPQRIHGTGRIEPLRCSIVVIVLQGIHGTGRIEPLRCSIVVIVLQGIHGTGRIEPLRCSIVVIVLQGIHGTGRIEPLRCSIVVIVLQGIHGTGRIEPRSSYRHFVRSSVRSDCYTSFHSDLQKANNRAHNPYILLSGIRGEKMRTSTGDRKGSPLLASLVKGRARSASAKSPRMTDYSIAVP